MSSVNLSPVVSGGQTQASDSSHGSSAAEKIAAIMKRITELQKQEAAIQGNPQQVAEQKRAIDAQIKVLEMQIEQIRNQEAQKNQQAAQEKLIKEEQNNQNTDTNKAKKTLGPGNIIDLTA